MGGRRNPRATVRRVKYTSVNAGKRTSSRTAAIHRGCERARNIQTLVLSAHPYCTTACARPKSPQPRRHTQRPRASQRPALRRSRRSTAEVTPAAMTTQRKRMVSTIWERRVPIMSASGLCRDGGPMARISGLISRRSPLRSGIGASGGSGPGSTAHDSQNAIVNRPNQERVLLVGSLIDGLVQRQRRLKTVSRLAPRECQTGHSWTSRPMVKIEPVRRPASRQALSHLHLPGEAPRASPTAATKHGLPALAGGSGQGASRSRAPEDLLCLAAPCSPCCALASERRLFR
jgi:hypothetical protein